MRFPARASTIKRMDRPVNQNESPLEILRRVENIVRAGTVAEVRHGKPARCRVRTGDLLTNWVPWMAGRAGGKRRQWWPPEIGEQCLLLAPSGDLLNAVAIPGIPSDKAPQGSESGTECRTDWSETDHMTHDSATGGTLRIECGQEIELRVGGAVLSIKADSITLSVGGGSLTVSDSGVVAHPDVVASRISLVGHIHGGVEVGDAKTKAPE